ncbi:spore germination protein [Ureibacillus manganicus]|uniref:Spore gernimation protein n=1 Tax=Ureibacillus manganicus DSM 26584 TaxID=1384049 RepID=A0A0A3IVJ5_9BACL|nr:spore germination protein [Ureibacillus manganicus]KGR78832.1 spore gernimation protein [Ureibacillus manganicus DSM 26584]
MFNNKKDKKNEQSTNNQQELQEPTKHYTKSELKQTLDTRTKEEFVNLIKDKVSSPADFIVKNINDEITIIYIENLIEVQSLNDNIISTLQSISEPTPQLIKEKLSLAQVDISNKLDVIIYELIGGAALIHTKENADIVVAKISSYQSRSLSAPENESQVIGTQVGFNENLTTNISLIRRFIKSPNLCNENFEVGEDTVTSISLLYLKGTASEEQVNTIRQRIESLDVSGLIDSAILAELIDDSTKTVFPQMLLTERPDRFCDGLLSGKIGIMMNGSSMGIVTPIAFIEFFHSKEDQNLRWQIGTMLRLLRFSAIIASVFLTPIYVAALTYHYEIISHTLIVPLSESRAIVPFPPILEALFLELIIELLREAGSRLPTKVGQTVGIVGGIVIGTAAVDAGITSNILIIFVALSALASFTTPNYVMANIIRFLRFPIIILAGIWGFLGIMIAVCFLLIHLLRLSSLGAPYLSPLYPLRLKDLPNSLIRLPLSNISRQAVNTRKGDDESTNQENNEKVSE